MVLTNQPHKKARFVFDRIKLFALNQSQTQRQFKHKYITIKLLEVSTIFFKGGDLSYLFKQTFKSFGRVKETTYWGEIFITQMKLRILSPNRLRVLMYL